MSKKTPIVAIIGRANVGKSSLLNAVAGYRRAIVAKEAGTTRDNVTAEVLVGDKTFLLVDTAGLKSAGDDFEAGIQHQITEAANSAAVIWIVVDSTVPPSDEDRRVAKLALRSEKPLILVANKADRKSDQASVRLQSLGIKPILTTSASQRSGITELLEATSELLPVMSSVKSKPRTKVVIVGRPNAGKSALFNSLAKKQQTLVSERAGTTRDAISLDINYMSVGLEITDTAGIRKGGKVERGVEKFSVLRALKAINESDVVLLVMDKLEAGTHVDQKIAGLAKESGKGLVLVINKWDLADDPLKERQDLTHQLIRDFVFVPWAPIIFTSALTGLNVSKLFDIVIGITQARRLEIPTPKLNSWLRKAVGEHSPAGLKNSHPKLMYVTQELSDGPPTFKIQGRNTDKLHWSYKRYLDRSLRQEWPMDGTPIKLIFSG